MKFGRSVLHLASQNGLAFSNLPVAALALVFCAIQSAPPLAAATTFSEPFAFYSGPGGACPNGKALLVSPGQLFGTTYYGGDDDYGVVYELNWSGTAFSETVLYSFKGGTDGGNPTAGLYMDANGAIYGTASTSSGLNNGVVFQLVPSGGTYTYKVIHAFGGTGDGAFPNSNLIAGKNGGLYGTTVAGGANGLGTVFEVVYANGAWTESVLYSFTGAADGSQPYAGLSADSANNLYGAAYTGGSANAGTVFELSPPAKGKPTWTDKTLYSFTGGTDGLNPLGGITITAAGGLLGTTYLGGSSNAGVVFELKPAATVPYKETVIVSFNGTNGANPSDTLVPDPNGNFFGSTGGAEYGNGGNVFKLSPTPHGLEPLTLSVIYSFTGGADGQAALPSISQTLKGAIFGTTFYGGYGGAGSVFEIY